MSNQKGELNQSREFTMKSFQFTWQIANYSSRAQNCAPKRAIKSRPFVVSDEESSINFALSFYPVDEARSENDPNYGNAWSGLFLEIESKIKYDGNYHIVSYFGCGRQEISRSTISQKNPISK